MLARFAGHNRLAEYATLFRRTGQVHETTLAGLPSPQWPKTIHRPPTEIMPIRPIIRYPDPRLALPAQPVTVFDDALRELAKDLLETMHAAPGIGITAPPSMAHEPTSIRRSSGRRQRRSCIRKAASRCPASMTT
jgi:hypothetical protein